MAQLISSPATNLYLESVYNKAQYFENAVENEPNTCGESQRLQESLQLDPGGEIQRLEEGVLQRIGPETVM